MSDSYLPFRTDYNRWSDPSRDESPARLLAEHVAEASRETFGSLARNLRKPREKPAEASREPCGIPVARALDA